MNTIQKLKPYIEKIVNEYGSKQFETADITIDLGCIRKLKIISVVIHAIWPRCEVYNGAIGVDALSKISNNPFQEDCVKYFSLQIGSACNGDPVIWCEKDMLIYYFAHDEYTGNNFLKCMVKFGNIYDFLDQFMSPDLIPADADDLRLRNT